MLETKEELATQFKEEERLSHEIAMEGAFRKGKGVLPSNSQKPDAYMVGGATLGCALAFLIVKGLFHMEGEMLPIALCVVGLVAGAVSGDKFFRSQFVVDKSWHKPFSTEK